MMSSWALVLSTSSLDCPDIDEGAEGAPHPGLASGVDPCPDSCVINTERTLGMALYKPVLIPPSPGRAGGKGEAEPG